MSDGQSQCDSLAQSPHAQAPRVKPAVLDAVSVALDESDEATEPAVQVPKCSLVDVNFLFPSSWGNSSAYQRLRHLRSIEASALRYQLERESKSTPMNERDVPALRRIDAFMEIQRRECFRLDGKNPHYCSNSHMYLYAARNEDGEIIRKESVRDRVWPPKEFALKNTPKTGPGRGGGRKRKVPDKTPAQLDEERLAMDTGKTCIDCGAMSSPLWRQVDAVVEIPDTLAPDQEVIIPKEDICLACYVQRTCGSKVRAGQLSKKKKEKALMSKAVKDESSKLKKMAAAVPVAPSPAVSTPIVPVASAAESEGDEADDISTGDDKRRKKSTKKSSKKKKKKSKRSSSSAPGSPAVSPKRSTTSPKKSNPVALTPLVVVHDDDNDSADMIPPPPTSRSSRKESKKRSRDASPRVTPKASKSSKKDSAAILPIETPREKELRAKGQYCPVCNRTYEDDDASEFVCCDGCEMWVHSFCDPLMNAERLHALADTDAKYIGPCCAHKKRQR
ncbi:hypothetical protein H310_04013 [Aphanomyces invadans]|uniref:GATA-type domain-containing protein n=1 Tax=Aphanomyces invadans TaxID=157072 RepID=A0A024UEV7_9STRA|nr:hypothetical protein H310_04013 [Aphanomyces invadans]ETW04911.1 hypothetical protein H310_04013 [Aphanomyces invadans]|eukprot:XP_008866349.1 hypothetical protein H310_04013 [Aphanomyces invadans]